MKKLRELQEQYKQVLNEARNIRKKAESEERSLSSEELSAIDSALTRAENMRSEIETLQRLVEEEQRAGSPAGAPPSEPVDQGGQDGDTSEERQWGGFGEFLHAVRFNTQDERLHYRDLSAGVSEAGGYLVPTEHQRRILQVDGQSAIFRPRATVIPAGTQPDAGVSIPALDQSGTKGVYSGVQVTWIGEGDEKPVTEPTFREIEWTPYEVAGHTVVTDKLLRNAPAAGTLVETLLRRAIIASEEHNFLTGDGSGKPTGIINHPATVKINRKVANTITYDDLVDMYSRMMFGGSLVWLGSQSVLPHLMRLRDEAGQNIWMPNAREGAPGTLLGIPFLMPQYSPLLGNVGDLVLADLQYYIIKDGAGIYIDASPHVHFTRNKTVIKAFWNVDGKPWLSTPIQHANGYEVSPFVALDLPGAGD